MALAANLRMADSGAMEEDEIIKRAQERLRAIIDERRELESFIATYRKLAAETQSASGEAVPAPVRAASTDEIVSAAMTLIAAKGAPMRIGEIHEALTAQDIKIGGRNPRNNLGAKLSADRRLESVPGHGWWFRGEALPPHVASESYPRQLGVGENAEGPATDVARPYSNGAAVGAA